MKFSMLKMMVQPEFSMNNKFLYYGGFKKYASYNKLRIQFGAVFTSIFERYLRFVMEID